MKLNKEIINLIKTDNEFSLGLASVLKISQFSAQQLARRKSAKLRIYEAIEYYKSKGFTEENLFETETVEK